MSFLSVHYGICPLRTNKIASCSQPGTAVGQPRSDSADTAHVGHHLTLIRWYLKNAQQPTEGGPGLDAVKFTR